jgi:hypothetical protein
VPIPFSEETMNDLFKVILVGTVCYYSSASFSGNIFKWVDKDGQVHYENKPPASTSTIQINADDLSKTNTITAHKIEPEKKRSQNTNQHEKEAALQEKQITALVNVNQSDIVGRWKLDAESSKYIDNPPKWTFGFSGWIFSRDGKVEYKEENASAKYQYSVEKGVITINSPVKAKYTIVELSGDKMVMHNHALHDFYYLKKY